MGPVHQHSDKNQEIIKSVNQQINKYMTVSFKALRIEEASSGQFTRTVLQRKTEELPEGDVLIKVHFAGLNYKDALSSIGNRGVTKHYPHTPGIDGAGVVEESRDPAIAVGDEVIVTGFDLGMNTDGAFAGYIRVPAEWVVPLPKTLSLKESMIIGTAGLTAGIGLYKMEKMGQRPADGPVVVTGSTGGVGSLAVGILARAGYEVIAATGKVDATSYLQELGASEVVSREFVNDKSDKPLMRAQWSGAIDTVGGNTLSTLLKGCKRGGSVAACGLVDTPSLSTTVFPFILNGINLLGLDSATFPMQDRLVVWQNLATHWKVPNLDRLTTTCSLEELDHYIEQILQGKVKGRVVVDLNAS